MLINFFLRSETDPHQKSKNVSETFPIGVLYSQTQPNHFNKKSSYKMLHIWRKINPADSYCKQTKKSGIVCHIFKLYIELTNGCLVHRRLDDLRRVGGRLFCRNTET